MAHDPDIERFFQELKEANEVNSARSASDRQEEPVNIGKPMQIVVLAEPDGDIIARIEGLGEFQLAPSGEVYFHYRNDEGQHWYVNRCVTTFLEAVHVFKKCGEDVCRRFALDEDAEPEATWALERLHAEFERIEPLGDPKTCLWSATALDEDGGLLRLF